MNDCLVELPAFLERWQDGSIHVAGHRILLVEILDAVYANGGIQEVEDRFPSVPPATLKSVWFFCLDNAAALRPFHEEHLREARAAMEATSYSGPTREELLRRLKREAGSTTT